MRTICLKKPGNRRSENNQGGGTAPATGATSIREVLSDTPKISTKTFVSPGVPPIKAMPSIRELVSAKDTNATNTATSIAESNEMPLSPEKQEPTEKKQPTAEKEEETTTTLDTKDLSTSQQRVDSFESCWKTLFEELFAQNHLIYYSLKDETPRYENDIIYVEVKNNIQKEQIEMRKISILEYWRNHFSYNVDDIEVIVNEQKEDKKVIISAEDKLRNMAEQNVEFFEFLNILDFRMKE